MDTITFRTVTPIFEFEFEDKSDIFDYSGSLNDASYNITLKFYPQGTETFEELVKFVAVDYRNELTAIYMHPLHSFATCYFLVINLMVPETERTVLASNSLESLQLTSAMLSALNLHSTKEIRLYNTYEFRSPPHQYTKYGKSTPNIGQTWNSLFGMSTGMLN